MNEVSNAVLTPYLLREFAARCQGAFDLCVLHKELFDRNIEDGYMKKEPFYSIWGRINNTTQEHSLLQIVKLHDPASQQIKGKKKYNLGIEYILKNGAWTEKVFQELSSYCDEMNKLYESIKIARNWTFCHNDVDAINAKEVLGTFDKDADEPYFFALEKFVNVAYINTLKESFQFERYLKDDVHLFIKHFNRN